jgi:hypothetical protein
MPGCEHLAGSAPGGAEVHQHGLAATHHLILENKEKTDIERYNTSIMDRFRSDLDLLR